MRLLIIEDEKGLSDAIAHMLKARQWLVTAQYDGKSGLEEALTGIYDAIVLDVMLPAMDGFEVLSQLRAQGVQTPVLLLTAKTGLENRVHGLNLGADYFLAKPFEMEELLACINAISRRKESKMESKVPSFGDVEIDTSCAVLRCTATGSSVKMSAREMNLAEMLVRSEGRIVGKNMISEKLWGLENDSEYNNTEVYISFLRKKLAFIGSDTAIRTARGIGYYLEYGEG